MNKTSFTLNDGSTTPVARTFNLLTRVNNTLSYQRSDGSTVRALKPLLQIKQDMASAARPTDKVEIAAIVPYFKVVDGVDTFQKVNRIDIKCTIDAATPQSFIADLYAYALSALGDAAVKASIVTRENVTG